MMTDALILLGLIAATLAYLWFYRRTWPIEWTTDGPPRDYVVMWCPSVVYRTAER